MKVTFYQSSAVMIEMDGIKILNDPWLVDGELYGAWNHYPRIKLKPEDFIDSNVNPSFLENSCSREFSFPIQYI